MPKLTWIKALLTSVCCLTWGSALFATTYQVTTPTSDVSYHDTPTSGSLPWCVAQANANFGPDRIEVVLDPESNSITVMESLEITDQTDFWGNSITVGSRGSSYRTFSCFAFKAGYPGSDGSTLTGFCIGNSWRGVYVESDYNLISGCWIGADQHDQPISNFFGVVILAGYFNTIGDPERKNVISCNSQCGIQLMADYNRVMNCYLGTNSNGTAALAGQDIGIEIYTAAHNMIGGNRLNLQGNLISGNESFGIRIRDVESYGNSVVGNLIGLNLTETGAIPNGVSGIEVSKAGGNALGLPWIHYENVIAANGNYNIRINAGVSPPEIPLHNTIQNNFIGVDSLGQPYSNQYGIYLDTAQGTQIGGNRNGYEYNVIGSHTLYPGIYVNGGQNSICGNYIGCLADGITRRANQQGVQIQGYGNLIGGGNSADTMGNIISGNLNHGIYLATGGGNTIVGNWIGLNGAGMNALANELHGIYIASSCHTNLIGSDLAAYRNVISGNTQYGVYLDNTNQNQVRGNYFGLQANGLGMLTEGVGSLYVLNGDQDWIAGNWFSRSLVLTGPNCRNNSILGNVWGIYTNRVPVAGLDTAIQVIGGAHDNTIGLPDAGVSGNLISNSQTGILVSDAGSVGNGIYGNTITAFATAGITLAAGGNHNRAAPVINSAVGWQFSGSASNSDRIELFLAEHAGGNGGSLRFLGNTTANGAGSWSIDSGMEYSGQYVCAVAINTLNDASGFSSNVLVIKPTPTVTSTVTATYTVTPTITPTFTITPTLWVSATSTISPTSTITPTQTPSPTISPTPSSTSSFTQTPTLDLSRVDLAGKILLAFPNPGKNRINFVVRPNQAAAAKIEIYNIMGERAATLSATVAQNTTQLLTWDCRSAASGFYFAVLLLDGKQYEIHKLAVAK